MDQRHLPCLRLLPTSWYVPEVWSRIGNDRLTYCLLDEPLCPKALLSGYTVDGSFQQYAIAKAAHVARIHKDIPLDAISPVLCAGITVYKGLKESGARPGQTVAIVGAGGGLGSLAQQYAKAMGLRTIAIDSGEEKKKMCLEQLGSHAFIDFAESKNVVEDVQKATEDGLGPHAVILVAVTEKPFQQAAEVSQLAWPCYQKDMLSHVLVRPPTWHRHRHRSSSGRLHPCTSLRISRQDDPHPGVLRRQPQRHLRGPRLLPPRPDQGAIQDRRSIRASEGVRSDARGQDRRSLRVGHLQVDGVLSRALYWNAQSGGRPWSFVDTVAAIKPITRVACKCPTQSR